MKEALLYPVSQAQFDFLKKHVEITNTEYKNGVKIYSTKQVDKSTGVEITFDIYISPDMESPFTIVEKNKLLTMIDTHNKHKAPKTYFEKPVKEESIVDYICAMSESYFCIASDTAKAILNISQKDYNRLKDEIRPPRGFINEPYKYTEDKLTLPYGELMIAITLFDHQKPIITPLK